MTGRLDLSLSTLDTDVVYFHSSVVRANILFMMNVALICSYLVSMVIELDFRILNVLSDMTPVMRGNLGRPALNNPSRCELTLSLILKAVRIRQTLRKIN